MILTVRAGLVVLALECVTVPLGNLPALAGRVCPSRADDQVRCVGATCGGLNAAAAPACHRRCRPAPIHTLAWVESECREDARGLILIRQALRVRRGECDAVTVKEVVGVRVPDPLPQLAGSCETFGESRTGYASPVFGVFQRIAVSPDGSRVVFEITDDFSIFGPQGLPPDQKGIYLVHADGGGLRRVGPPSREAGWRILVDPSVPLLGVSVGQDVRFAFSPDGRRIAYTDKGLGVDGGDAVQVVTVALDSGGRTQVTRLPVSNPPLPNLPVYGLRFLDDDTILFFSTADADGRHPDGGFYRVRIDGSGFEALPGPLIVPGSRLVPRFVVTGRRIYVLNLGFPDIPPANPLPFFATVTVEVFLVDGERLLQLTNFGRVDTAGFFVGVGGRRIFFEASVDLQGRNPTESCQLFSIDRLGRNLRQITDLNRGGPHVTTGCSTSSDGCFIGPATQDPGTGTIVFIAECDPFGTSPNGGQVFAMRPDGSGLRQFTDTNDLVVEPDGTVVATLPGPIGYSARFGF